jgi:hypothetical protein
MEWAFGTNPKDGRFLPIAWAGSALTQHGNPRVWMRDVGAGPEPAAIFCRRKDRVATGISYETEFTGDFAQWGGSPGEPVMVAEDAEFELVSVPFPATVGGVPTKSFRVRVTVQ